MITTLSEEELEFMECFYDPIALSECLFGDVDNLGMFYPEKTSHVRLGQLSLLSFEYLIDDKNPKLTDKENFKLREGAGSVYVFGGRKFGKSLYVEIMDCLVSMVLLDGENAGFTSLDAIHIRGILDIIVRTLENHKFYQLLEPKITRSPNYNIFLNNGYHLVSVNMNLHSNQPGNAFFQKHFRRLYMEEASFESEIVFNKRQDSVSEDGCVMRCSGMTNFTKYSPAGKVFYDISEKPKVINLPQYINPKWGKKEKIKMVKKYAGEACFDKETQILTDKGWKYYSELNTQLKVLSLNPKNNKAEYTNIKEVFIYNYNNKICSFQNRDYDIVVTPEHNLYTLNKKGHPTFLKAKHFAENNKIFKRTDRKKIKSGFCNICGKKLDNTTDQIYFCSDKCYGEYSAYEYYPLEKFRIKKDFIFKGKTIKSYTIPTISKNGKKLQSLDMNNFLSFLGWYISEGWVGINVNKNNPNNQYSFYNIFISQTKEKYLVEIKNIIKNMGFGGRKYIDKFTFINKNLGIWLIDNAGRTSAEKKVPNFIKFLSKEQITVFLNALFKGDGNGEIKPEGQSLYWTTSKQLADDVQELILKIGLSCKLHHHINNSGNIIYRLTVRKKYHDSIVHRKTFSMEHYNGKVWCVNTEPHNTIFVRRNGKCCWSGNSIGYRVFVKGEVVEEGVSALDMERVRENYSDEKKLKRIEINKDNIDNLKNILFLDRPKNSEMLFIDADIGETAPTEIIIISKVNDKYRYLYNITAYNLTDKDQVGLFSYIINQTKADVIGLDTTDGLGRAIFRALEPMFPEVAFCWCSFNEKIAVDFERNDNDKILFKNGQLSYKEEYVSEWSFMRLRELFYKEAMMIPVDFKLDEQLNSIIAIQGATRVTYPCVASEDHLYAAFLVFAISQWYIEFNLIKPKNRKTFCKRGV